MKKIIFSREHLGLLGGIHTVMQALALELQNRGNEISFAYTGDFKGNPVPGCPVYKLDKGISRTAFHEFAKKYPGPFGLVYLAKKIWAPMWKLVTKKRLKMYFKLIGNENIYISTTISDLVYLDEMGILDLPKSERPKIIAQIHTAYPYYQAWNPVGEYIQTIYQKVDKFVAIAESDSAGFSEEFKISATWIPNPAPISSDISRYSSEAKLIRIFVRLSEEKRVITLIKSFELASKHNPGWRLEIYGNGSEEQYIKKYLTDNNIQNIELFPPTNSVKSLLSGVSLNLLTSVAEGTPMSLIESSVSGIPCVVTPCSAEVVKFGEAGGYISEGYEAEDIARVLEIAMNNDSLRDEKSISIFDYGKQFNVSKVVDLWEREFDLI